LGQQLVPCLMTAIPQGCPFNPRCEYAVDICRRELPETVHFAQVEVACHEVSRLHNSAYEEQSA
jgi:peptide/nickel transport system ATP-binding protein